MTENTFAPSSSVLQQQSTPATKDTMSAVAQSLSTQVEPPTSSPALPATPEAVAKEVTTPAVAASAVAASAVASAAETAPVSQTDDLEKELELDLENLKLDETIDTSVGIREDQWFLAPGSWPSVGPLN